MNESRTKRLFTYSIILLMFTGALCNATQGTLLTSYIDYYGLRSSSQGLMSSMQSAGNLTALLLIGLLAGRMQKTTILMLSAITVPVMFFMLGSKPEFFLLLIGFLIYGVAFGFQDSLASALMVDLNPEKSGYYMNILHGVFGIGALSAPVVYDYLMDRGMPWNGILIFVACLCTISCLLYLILRIRVKQCFQGVIVPAKAIGFVDIRRFLSEQRKAVLLCSAILFGAHQIGISSWIVRYVSVFLLAPEYGAFSLSLFWVGTAASRLFSAVIPLPRAKKIFFGFLLSSAFIAIGIIFRNGLLMAICCLLAGLAEGPILPLMLDMSCSWERENTSLGSTMLLLALYIGFLIMPVLIGKLASSINMTTAMLTTVITSLLGGACSAKLVKNDF